MPDRGNRDQREHQRVQASFRVRSTALDPGEVASENFSRGGIFIKTVRFLPQNAVIRLSIEVPGTDVVIPATCRVAFVRGQADAAASGKPAGMGLELLDIADDKRRELEKILVGMRGEAAPPPSEDADGPLRIVVVDDDARYREAAAEPFRSRGDTVVTTSDGLEAIALCLKDPPDVVLSDVQMPRMDGWQLLRLIRARPSLASVPVVFLTSLGGEAERLLGYQLGVDAYIPKPYQADELLMRVHQIVRRAKNPRSAPGIRSALRGDIEHVGLSSLFTFIEMERKSGTLLVVGDDVARLFFKTGKLLRAEIEGPKTPVAAKKAVMQVLDFRSGQFEFSAGDVAVSDELATTTTALLLEHARLTDERAKK